MKGTLRLILTIALLSAWASSQDKPTPPAEPGPAHAAGKASTRDSASTGRPVIAGSSVEAELTQTLDARKMKAGDPVTAKTKSDLKSDGKVTVPKGSRLLGHVTEASARAKGASNSSLGFMFDNAVLKNGTRVPIQGVVRAIAPPRVLEADMNDDVTAATPLASGRGASSTRMEGSSPGLVGGAAGTVNGAAPVATGAVNDIGQTTGGVTSSAGALTSVGTPAGSAVLNSNSSGVIGFKDLQLSSSANSNTSATVLTSTGNTVHLDSGTQLMLAVSGPGTVSPAAAK